MLVFSFESLIKDDKYHAYRCVMSVGGVAVPLSKDHVPYDPVELQFVISISRVSIFHVSDFMSNIVQRTLGIPNTCCFQVLFSCFFLQPQYFCH